MRLSTEALKKVLAIMTSPIGPLQQVEQDHQQSDGPGGIIHEFKIYAFIS